MNINYKLGTTVPNISSPLINTAVDLSAAIQLQLLCCNNENT